MEFTQLMPVSDPETGDLFTGLLPKSTANYVMVNHAGNRLGGNAVADCITFGRIAGENVSK